MAESRLLAPEGEVRRQGGAVAVVVLEGKKEEEVDKHLEVLGEEVAIPYGVMKVEENAAVLVMLLVADKR